MNGRLISGTVRVVAFAAALLMLTVLVVTRSQAAFTSTTSNAGSNFTAGTIGLSDDDSGVAMFSLTGLVPGPAQQRCITVTYTGDVTPAPIRLYGTSGGALAPYLDLVVEVGTGGSFAGCGGFSGAPVYSGTLSAFSAGHSGWASGIATHSATPGALTRTFRFSVSVQDNNAAQSLTGSASFTWETQV